MSRSYMRQSVQVEFVGDSLGLTWSILEYFIPYVYCSFFRL